MLLVMLSYWCSSGVVSDVLVVLQYVAGDVVGGVTSDVAGGVFSESVLLPVMFVSVVLPVMLSLVLQLMLQALRVTGVQRGVASDDCCQCCY